MQDKELALSLQMLCREQLIRKILADVLADITVCELENWDWKILPKKIKLEMENILKKY